MNIWIDQLLLWIGECDAITFIQNKSQNFISEITKIIFTRKADEFKKLKPINLFIQFYKFEMMFDFKRSSLVVHPIQYLKAIEIKTMLSIVCLSFIFFQYIQGRENPISNYNKLHVYVWIFLEKLNCLPKFC